MINTLYILIVFFITGICIGILFDIFRISRKTFKTPDLLIYVEDIAFWVLAGLLILFTIFTFTNRRSKIIYDSNFTIWNLYLFYNYKQIFYKY